MTEPRATLPNPKLDRIENDIARLRRNPRDGAMLARFEYDHSNTLVIDSNGKKDLLIQNTVPLASDIARLLQHCSPAVVEELLRGYRIAKDAGILGGVEMPINEITGWVDHERAEGIYQAIHKAKNNRPGGHRV